MSVSTRDRLTLLVVVSLPLLVWWVGLYPGTFTNDSLSVIRQIRTDSWDNGHTNAYLTFVWLFSLGGSAWGLVALAQVTLLALGISSLGAAIIKSGVPKLLVVAASGIFALLPQVGAFAVTMWKDVPSSAGALMLAAALLERRLTSAPKTSTLWLLAVGALLLGSFRWNGPIALVLLSALLIVVQRRSSLNIVVVVLGIAVASTGTLLLPQQIGLTKSHELFLIDYRQLHDIAYVYHEQPSSISEPDEHTLSSLMPLERWSQGGSTCETVDVLLFGQITQFSPRAIENLGNQRTDLRALWRRVVRDEPLLVTWARLCRAGGVWSPIFFGSQPTLGLVYLHSNDSELGRPGYFPHLEKELIRAVKMTSSSETSRTITLNAMLWTLVAMSLALAVKSRQLARRFLLCLPVSVGVMMSVMLGAVAHDARYVAGPLLIAQYFVGITLLDWVWHRVSLSRRPEV